MALLGCWVPLGLVGKPPVGFICFFYPDDAEAQALHNLLSACLFAYLFVYYLGVAHCLPV